MVEYASMRLMSVSVTARTAPNAADTIPAHAM